MAVGAAQGFITRSVIAICWCAECEIWEKQNKKKNPKIKDYKWKIIKNSVWHLPGLLDTHQIRDRQDADPEKTRREKSDRHLPGCGHWLAVAGWNYCLWGGLTRNWTRLKVLNIYSRNAAIYQCESNFSNLWTWGWNIIFKHSEFLNLEFKHHHFKKFRILTSQNRQTHWRWHKMHIHWIPARILSIMLTCFGTLFNLTGLLFWSVSSTSS